MAREPLNDSSKDDADSAPDGLFGWVADFDDPAVVKAANSGPRAPRGKALPIAIAGGSAFVVAATVIAALLRPFEAESGLPTTGSAPVVPSAPSSSSSSAPSADPVPTDTFTILPASCDGLYGSAMLREFERQSMQLNLVWAGAREATPGSGDPELIALLRGKPSIDCFWLDETGGSKNAVLTVATEPGVAVTDAVAARLVALGFSQQNDRGGVRYFKESREGGEAKGESHFLREGVWLATNWYGFGPWGYTGHMAEQVFY